MLTMKTEMIIADVEDEVCRRSLPQVMLKSSGHQNMHWPRISSRHASWQFPRRKAPHTRPYSRPHPHAPPLEGWHVPPPEGWNVPPPQGVPGL